MSIDLLLVVKDFRTCFLTEAAPRLRHLNGRGSLLRRTLRCRAATMWTAVSALSLSWRSDFTGFAFTSRALF